MIQGIPYFGVDTLKIEEKITNNKIEYTKKYDSLYELIQSEKSSDNVVIIENDKGKWITYIRDINFNYRDKEVYIPYYEYKIHKMEKGNIRSNYKGHLRIVDDKIEIRHSYTLRKLYISINSNNSMIIYNFRTDEKYKVTFDKYFSEDKFDIDELYNNYLLYSINEEDYKLFKHTEGYHLISKELKGIKNKEKELRNNIGLQHIIYNNTDEFKEYRDVRKFSLESFVKEQGIIDIDKPYWERKLDFESLLFCITNSGAKPSNDFITEWDKLGKTKSYIKYGNDIKLIIKDYWLYNSTIGKKYSWSRI